ncbi:metal-dependent hydrolase [Halobellus captivus]|uniref:metal-dependent hydrolase n=1 Tax=Halobellus captivus TaxID=2592614 RepID=UPI0011A216C6|nr:metal-dependent hydrolase [Halobellus captivus]
MWPWEHLAFGYVIYSLGVHLTWRRAPGGAEAVVVAIGTQAPDLIDKPLSWGLEVFPMGYAVGHSILFSLPLTAVAVWIARRYDRAGIGIALAVGYLSHLAGDVLSPFLSGGALSFDRLLWPLVSFPAYETDHGFVGRFSLYVGRYLHEATDPSNLPYVLAYLSVFFLVSTLWVIDGAPGVRQAIRTLRSVASDG